MLETAVTLLACVIGMPLFFIVGIGMVELSFRILYWLETGEPLRKTVRGTKGVPEPSRCSCVSCYKLMPDGHTRYGPEPNKPPPPPDPTITPTTVKGNYPKRRKDKE